MYTILSNLQNIPSSYPKQYQSREGKYLKLFIWGINKLYSFPMAYLMSNLEKKKLKKLVLIVERKMAETVRFFLQVRILVC